MFVVEEYFYDFLMESFVWMLNFEEVDWFYIFVYIICDLILNGFFLFFKLFCVMRSVISYIFSYWLYWNRIDGVDYFFVVLYDFVVCFYY